MIEKEMRHRRHFLLDSFKKRRSYKFLCAASSFITEALQKSTEQTRCWHQHRTASTKSTREGSPSAFVKSSGRLSIRISTRLGPNHCIHDCLGSHINVRLRNTCSAVADDVCCFSHLISSHKPYEGFPRGRELQEQLK
ncbi:hypothetical protein PC121_g21946 [Phytophthora cactorum]|nr:hypothetical protein PC121_g21946 [Phytophthora cactorum]